MEYEIEDIKELDYQEQEELEAFKERFLGTQRYAE